MAKKEKSKAELEKRITALEKENKKLKLDRSLLNSLLKMRILILQPDNQIIRNSTINQLNLLINFFEAIHH